MELAIIELLKGEDFGGSGVDTAQAGDRAEQQSPLFHY